MNKSVVLAIATAALLLGAIPAHADVVDDCALSLPDYVEYGNLYLSAPSELGWADVADTDLLVMGGQNSAEAVYNVKGSVSVAITAYSKYGCCASSGSKGLRLGGTDGIRLLYDPSTDDVFYFDSGEYFRLEYDALEASFVFLPCSAPADCVAYGVSVLWSEDGVAYTEARTSVDSCRALSGCVREEYSASLPRSAEYVRISLITQSSVPVSGRNQRVNIKSSESLVLGRVELPGARPAAEPLQQDTEPSDDADSVEQYDDADRPERPDPELDRADRSEASASEILPLPESEPSGSSSQGGSSQSASQKEPSQEASKQQTSREPDASSASSSAKESESAAAENSTDPSEQPAAAENERRRVSVDAVVIGAFIAAGLTASAAIIARSVKSKK